MSAVCTGVIFLAGLAASFTAMMLALVAPTATCMIACVMLCSFAIFAMAFLRLPCVSLHVSSIFSLPCVRFCLLLLKPCKATYIEG